jgi:hypothetical protein
MDMTFRQNLNEYFVNRGLQKKTQEVLNVLRQKFSDWPSNQVEIRSEPGTVQAVFSIAEHVFCLKWSNGLWQGNYLSWGKWHTHTTLPDQTEGEAAELIFKRVTQFQGIGERIEGEPLDDILPEELRDAGLFTQSVLTLFKDYLESDKQQ